MTLSSASSYTVAYVVPLLFVFISNLSDAMQDIVLGVYDYDLGNKDGT